MTSNQFWIDVGGTFTDCLHCDETGRLSTFKLLSDGSLQGLISDVIDTKIRLANAPHNSSDFFCDWQISLFDKEGQLVIESEVSDYDANSRTLSLRTKSIPPGCFRYRLTTGEESPIVAIRWFLGLSRYQPLGHLTIRLGTTRGTNALLERQGVAPLLVVTKGFADVLAIGYQNRPDLFKLDIVKPEPLYHHVIEVDERVNSHGLVTRPLAEREESRLTEIFALALREGDPVTLAISLLNAHKNNVHEQRIASIAKAAGLRNISMGTQLAEVQKYVSRTDTTVVNAYLTPVIDDYLHRLQKAAPLASIQVMTSSGGLVDAGVFCGKDSILSGPAGGVVGVSHLAKDPSIEGKRLIGFDMGGTSTDVSRYVGVFERRFEMELTDEASKTGVRIVAPMLAIDTVAAGGGSLCWFDGTRMRVGPRSAGADPGPACYGKGGPLTITDCNVLLGRVRPDHFAFPLDARASHLAMQAFLASLKQALGARPEKWTTISLAEEFLTVAASQMASPIKKMAIAKGDDLTSFSLVSFGGAGSQHACAVADKLGIKEILVHPYASILSAFGLGTADIRILEAKDVGTPLSTKVLDTLPWPDLYAQASSKFSVSATSLGLEEYKSLDLQFDGQQTSLTIAEPADGDWGAAFERSHQRYYGFCYRNRPIMIRTMRLELVCVQQKPHTEATSAQHHPAQSIGHVPAVFQNREENVPLFNDNQLRPGAFITGPAILDANHTSIMIENGWLLEKTATNVLRMRRQDNNGRETYLESHPQTSELAALSLFSHQLTSIAEQMGVILQKTAVSVNVKERLDFSCALFDSDGNLLVNAPHIPVHLGAMGETVRAVKARFPEMVPGDVYITNDPLRGGSHIPDVTVITPIFSKQAVVFYAASRAHHAEIGGKSPGSMPANSTHQGEEGVLIEPQKIVRAGRLLEKEIALLLRSGKYPSRAVRDNMSDLSAQVAAGQLGAALVGDLIAQRGLATLQQYAAKLQLATATAMRRRLKDLGPGNYSFEDTLDGSLPMAVNIVIDPDGGAIFDFRAIAQVHPGNLNATPAILRAATLYVLRCLIGEDIPLNEGVLVPIKILYTTPSLVSPADPQTPAADRPAVAGGNVETSQRLCDIMFAALGQVAASQGTMNNLLFGRSGESDAFGYYETICGGTGAGKNFAGASAVQSHMTNTRMTDPEVMEELYPVMVQRFAIRKDSGGEGKYRGGDGAIRELLFLADLDLTLVTSRRASSPFGLQGGASGLPGKNLLQSADGRWTELPEMATIAIKNGDMIRIETPGGGGFGVSQEPV